jgi:sterol desaturase/sphingolipid hydroxylase (fatty acid hydroxylase superfamily)
MIVISLSDFANRGAGWMQEHWMVPLLYRLHWMKWEDLSYGWSLFAIYGLVQVMATYAVCVPMEKIRPIEIWPDRKAVLTDVLYTLIMRVGLVPVAAFVVFYGVQTWVNGFIVDQGWVPPSLETVFPFLMGWPAITFVLYLIILDFADYWRHRLSHRFYWWYCLHSLHHAQRQMTFWSDDRNHLLDDLISGFWFGAVALLIGVAPMQFPLLVLTARFLESMSHANARVSFGPVGEYLLISPRFHRLHHGIGAAGRKSVNYGGIFPWWDMMFGTADFSPVFIPTGDPSADEAMHSGSYWAQQVSGLKRLLRALRPVATQKG